MLIVEETKPGKSAKQTNESPERQGQSRRVPLLECLTATDPAMQRLVLVAPSGVGKSTAVNERLQALVKTCVPFMMLRLPTLRLSSARGTNAQLRDRIQDSIERDIAAKLPDTKDVAAKLARSLIANLDAAPGVILFDALDEVPQDERDEVIDCVRSFLYERARHPTGHRVLITSRPYAYTGQFESDQFKRIELAEFTPSQQDELIGKWFKQRRKSAETGRALIKQLAIARTGASPDQAAFATLMTEPMLLTYACMLAEGSPHDSESPLPPTRHTLFEGVVSLMLEKWDQNRNHGLVDSYKPLFERTDGKPSVLRRLLEQAALEELVAQAPVFDWDTEPQSEPKSKPSRTVPNAAAHLARERIVAHVDEAMPETLPVRAYKVVDWLAERSGLLHAISDEQSVRYALQVQLCDFLAVDGFSSSAKTDDATVDALLRLFRNQPEWYRPLASMTQGFGTAISGFGWCCPLFKRMLNPDREKIHALKAER